MARSRDYAAENAAREARARAAGFESEYDRRMHDFGRSQERASGERARQLGGHRGEADFERLVSSGDIAAVSAIPTDRDSFGRWVTVTLLVEMNDGTTREYTLRKQHLAGRSARDHLNDLYYDMIDAGVEVLDRYELLAG